MLKAEKFVTGTFGRRHVVLSNGTKCSWNTRGRCFRIVYPPRWDTAVATSLQNKAMQVAVDNGRERVDAVDFLLYEKFVAEVERLTSLEDAVRISRFLARLEKIV